jgi:hypothetical protein
MGILERISKLDDSFYDSWQTGKYSEAFHITYQKLSNDIAEAISSRREDVVRSADLPEM